MKQCYIFEYQNENDFRKKERTLRKYNMFAFKKLTFEYYPEIRNGNFLGVTEESGKAATVNTPEDFSKVLSNNESEVKITLNDDISFDKNIVIPTGKTVTLKLDGNTVDMSAKVLQVH